MDEQPELKTSAYNRFATYINSFNRNQRLSFLVGFIVLVIIYLFFHSPPADFPLGQVINIREGESLQSIASTLYDTHVIRSRFTFSAHVILLGGEKNVMAGDYLLDERVGPTDLAYRLVHGKYHLNVVKATIPEGWNTLQIGDYLGKNLIDFNKRKFILLAKSKEGYLFPDTYFISPTAKPENIIQLMNDTFNDKISSIGSIATSTHKLKDVIIMASIIENEARTTESRRTVAGILWKRLSLGMPLQVDSTFLYINGKNTYELTLDDLKIDSPYNTYKYKGLPPGPISNPGLDAINSTLNPITTKYLYFLSSRDGKMYYAKTFEEHKRNKELYLN
ncbi:MAG: endolytic transglycosylase MltG [Minisyncoccia bacterium]